MFSSLALRAAGIALAVSIAANAGLWYAYRGALLDTERVRTEVLAAANASLGESLGHQATAFAVRESELLHRLELSDQVTRSALERAENSEANLRKFRGAAAEQARTDPVYAEWARQPLPSGVAQRLQELQ